MVEHVGHRVPVLQHVVYRAEQGGVRGALDRRFGYRGGE
jgi:hypothetical protein